MLLAHVPNERLSERSHAANAHSHQTGCSYVEGVGKKGNEGNAEVHRTRPRVMTFFSPVLSESLPAKGCTAR